VTFERFSRLYVVDELRFLVMILQVTLRKHIEVIVLEEYPNVTIRLGPPLVGTGTPALVDFVGSLRSWPCRDRGLASVDLVQLLGSNREFSPNGIELCRQKFERRHLRWGGVVVKQFNSKKDVSEASLVLIKLFHCCRRPLHWGRARAFRSHGFT
jgi:hypothetical protein